MYCLVDIQAAYEWRRERVSMKIETITAMVDYAREQGAKKITVCVDKKNEGSNAVVRKLGFTVAEESEYKKRGTDVMCADYKYELWL